MCKYNCLRNNPLAILKLGDWKHKIIIHMSVEGLTMTEQMLVKFLSCFNFVAAFLAVVGNTLVAYALWKSHSLHPPSKLLLGSLALTDLCIGLYPQPAIAVQMRISHPSSIMEDMRERYFPISSVCIFSGSVLTITAIAVDRYLAAHLGQQYRVVVTGRRITVVLAFIWGWSVSMEAFIRFCEDYASILLWSVIGLCALIATIERLVNGEWCVNVSLAADRQVELTREQIKYPIHAVVIWLWG